MMSASEWRASRWQHPPATRQMPPPTSTLDHDDPNRHLQHDPSQSGASSSHGCVRHHIHSQRSVTSVRGDVDARRARAPARQLARRGNGPVVEARGHDLGPVDLGLL